jgi:hypothetical protein
MATWTNDANVLWHIGERADFLMCEVHVKNCKEYDKHKEDLYENVKNGLIVMLYPESCLKYIKPDTLRVGH